MPTAIEPQRRHDETSEVAELLERFDRTPSDELPQLRDRAESTVERLATQGQVPDYLVVEPQDPDPVVERILLAVLRRISRR